MLRRDVTLVCNVVRKVPTSFRADVLNLNGRFEELEAGGIFFFPPVEREK